MDLLIKLFRRLKHKSSIDEIHGIDKAFYQNFEYLLNNYEMMKDQISKELLDKFGEPVKDMIAGLVEQLKDELGEDVEDLEDIEDAPEALDPEPKRDTGETIGDIDARLQDPGLTEEQINELLDRRSKLKK
ncbi:MAG: hypothetical protein R6T99_02205 [Bacteroidales bacterium]